MVTYNSFHNKEKVMRKALIVLTAMVMMASVCFAVQVQKEIIDETLSTSNTEAEADLNIADSKRVSFFMTLDNNRTTASVTATVTAAVSLNGTDWTDISWFDVAGGATPVTSEITTPNTTSSTSTKKQNYIGWLDNRNQAKYLRIRVVPTQIVADSTKFMAADNAELTVTVIRDK